MVTVRVTDKASNTNKDYLFHRAVLAFHSAYFAAQLNTQSQGGEGQKKVDIPSSSHEEWDVFSYWVNSDGLLVDELPPGGKIKDRYLPSKLLYKMWLFADLFWIPDLTYSVIDMLYDVYEYVHPDTTLRRFVAV